MGGKGSGGGGGGFAIRGAGGNVYGGGSPSGGGGGSGRSRNWGGDTPFLNWKPIGYDQGKGPIDRSHLYTQGATGERSQNVPRGQPSGQGGMSPQARATARRMGRDFLIGTILGGPVVGGAAAAHAAYRGSGTQGGSGELDPNDAIDRQIMDRLGMLENNRASLPGRQLRGGEVPMRRGSGYGRQEQYRTGTGPRRSYVSSILGGGDDDDDSLSSTSPTQADLNDFSF